MSGHPVRRAGGPRGGSCRTLHQIGKPIGASIKCRISLHRFCQKNDFPKIFFGFASERSVLTLVTAVSPYSNPQRK